jgi:hypothetical protein
VEFEHQLAVERDRTAEAARRREAATSRADGAEQRLAALEAAYAAYRAAQRDLPEAQLQRQLLQVGHVLRGGWVGGCSAAVNCCVRW